MKGTHVERKHCSHYASEYANLLVTWCVRCSGWRVARYGPAPGSGSGDCSRELYESHFLPAEETTPDELQAIVQRLFRCAQEWEQDAQNV